MRIIVLSGSPRRGGNTAIMVDAFKEGAESAGHEVEVVNVGAMNLKGCHGCQYCFTHDGACAINDEMTGVREALKTADMLVLASPIYWFDISSQLKTAINRLYAFAGVPGGFPFNKVAMLLDSGADGVYTAAKAFYKDMNAYLNWEDQGVITIGGMNGKGDMANNPKLEEVRAFGASLR